MDFTQKTITKFEALQLKQVGWKFDWSIPHQNGYEVYERMLEGNSEVQGMIALKHIRDQFYTHVDIVEAAPFNVGHNGKCKGLEHICLQAHVSTAGMWEMKDMCSLQLRQIWQNTTKRC